MENFSRISEFEEILDKHSKIKDELERALNEFESQKQALAKTFSYFLLKK